MIARSVLIAMAAIAAASCRSVPVATAPDPCAAAAAPETDWPALASFANGVEMHHPPAYVRKTGRSYGSNDPTAVVPDFVELWRDNRSSSTVMFAKAPEGALWFHTKPDSIGTCPIPSAAGTWRVRTRVGSSRTNNRPPVPEYFVNADMRIPGDTLLLRFFGSTPDTLERAAMLGMLRTFRFLGR